MQYKVTEKYARGEAKAIASFQRFEDAKVFVQAKLHHDLNFNNPVTYAINDGVDDLESHDPIGSGAQGSASGSGQGSQGQGTGQRAALTPFATVLRPTGMPLSTPRNEDDQEK